MVGAGLVPVAFEVFEVEVEALDGGLAGVEGLHGPGAEADGSQAGGRAEAFLGAAVADIQIPGVHLQVVAAEGGDGVDDDEGVMAVAELDDFGQGSEGAGGGFGVDDADGFDRAMFFEFVSQGGDIYGLAPIKVEDEGLGVAALGDVGEAVAKEAVAADDDFVAGFEDVGAGGFHSAGAGGG